VFGQAGQTEVVHNSTEKSHFFQGYKVNSVICFVGADLASQGLKMNKSLQTEAKF